ncbi:hypothetical protein C0Q70_12216 [Pomacea canaliculata]|uniref:C2H2-type domain-containing protein n=1 Tax=Pomacea canaliculata TaxID=400727 RepID=A0A2T7P0Y5_POMCA|nr:hypothetical protein C0Q70_12216 [Pomacea canaliculata]
MSEAETNQSQESEGGNMLKIKCKPPPVIKESEFRYQCEWDTCDQIETDMSAFIKHVGTHVVKYHQQTLHADLGTGICYTCGWRACGTQIIGSEIDFNRHIYFHVFHVRIKYVGTHLSNTLRLNTCQIGTQSRNWIPELPENLECSWQDCGIIYDNPYLFYCHVSLHAQVYSEGRDVPCKCLWADCDAVVRSRHRLKEHLRSHTQEKVIACPTCGSLFCSRTKLVDHFLRQTHSDCLMETEKGSS